MGLLSYIKPGKKAAEAKANAPAEMTEKSSPTTAIGTPGTMTPAIGGWSTPASIYPAGAPEFRSSQMDDINEIKCDVMVNWLYQQQMEKLWTAGGIDEGVVLKKGRGQYTCCPGDIVDEPYGFFKAVETLNVRVS